MPPTIPRSLEALIKKAAIDPEFKTALLQKRSKLAEEILLPLDPSEKEMLDKIPEGQLLQMIVGTPVSPVEREILQGSNFLTVGLAIGGVLAIFIAGLSSGGGSISSIFGGISATLGHTAGIIYYNEPPENLTASLSREIQAEVRNLPFPDAIKLVGREAGLTITLDQETVPKDLSFQIQGSSKGKTALATLRNLCQEAADRNGIASPTSGAFYFRYLPYEVIVWFASPKKAD